MVPKPARALRGSSVEAKYAPDPFIASDVASPVGLLGARQDESIPKPLRIRSGVIVLGVIAYEKPKVPLP